MLNWNNIRTRAAGFAERWKDSTQENAEAQSFWNELLQVYGIDRKRVAQFEKKVKGLTTGSGRGRVDLLWPGLFLAEHKSAGKSLEEAERQAVSYVLALPHHEKPQFVATSDFKHLRLLDIKAGKAEQFELSELPDRVESFGFLIGRQLRHQRASDPVNVQAAQQMGKLHDLLAAAGYTGHALELLLVRVLFLLFGDDTGLWDERGLFYDLLADHTRSDGEDTGATLARLFQVLDTPKDKRQTTLPAHFAAFPYVNGELFKERIDLADFSPKMREMLLDACTLDWGAVSPAIFGTMFQAALHPELRAELGAHYTSEENILKVLGPLFLDKLKEQREQARGNRGKLEQFLALLPRLRVFDPACGSGNFLLVAYRELRRLELSALSELLALEGKAGQMLLDISYRLRVNVGQFYGIEYEEFASQVARVALWLADHQMNIEASRELGHTFVNLPLKQSAHILNSDALTAEWGAWLNLEQDPPAALYICGNPPFLGSKLLNAEQRRAMDTVVDGIPSAGTLDYVSAWHIKAARLMQRVNRTGLTTATSLVSTNSITQGEQVAPLWTEVLQNNYQTITAAHRTFKWLNEAPRRAAVHCIIVQFQPTRTAPVFSRLFTYKTPTAQPEEHAAAGITPYLTSGETVIVHKAKKPLNNFTRMRLGTMPVDGGHLIFNSRQELDEFLALEPRAEKFIKQFLDGKTFLNGGMRWCLWLVDVTAAELAKMPEVRRRMQKVKELRLASPDPGANRLADTPGRFRESTVPERFIALPRVSSERREYIPAAYLTSETVVNDLLYMIPGGDLFTLGLVSSRAHMDWVRLVAGRLKSDYRYGADIVYNTFPWPDRASLKPSQVQAIETAAQAVLDTRRIIQERDGATLAQLYDPLTMSPALRVDHRTLDRAVDELYGLKQTDSEAERQAVLLEHYQRLAPTLDSQTAKPKKARKPRKTEPEAAEGE